MYFRIILFFVLFSSVTRACECSWKTIQDAYQMSTLVFYGKHIGTTKSMNVFDYSGNTIQFDNFEIIRFYKGFTKDSLPISRKISLKSTARESCGFIFDSNQYYLVYAELNSAGNFYEVNKCSRSKEIKNNQFIIPTQPDPEAGKDEQRELIRLAQADTNSTALLDWNHERVQLKLQHEKSQIATQKELKKKSSMSIVLSTTTLILLIYLLLDFWKKKTNS